MSGRRGLAVHGLPGTPHLDPEMWESTNFTSEGAGGVRPLKDRDESRHLNLGAPYLEEMWEGSYDWRLCLRDWYGISKLVTCIS